jgi:hypothetical protein
MHEHGNFDVMLAIDKNLIVGLCDYTERLNMRIACRGSFTLKDLVKIHKHIDK